MGLAYLSAIASNIVISVVSLVGVVLLPLDKKVGSEKLNQVYPTSFLPIVQISVYLSLILYYRIVFAVSSGCLCSGCSVRRCCNPSYSGSVGRS